MELSKHLEPGIERFQGILQTLIFSSVFFDSDLYVLNQRKDVVLILFYVDDLLITRNNDEIIQECISKLKAMFKITVLDILHYYLGM